MKTTTLVGLLVVLTIVAGLLLALSRTTAQQHLLDINSYEQCVNAGYPIMESYPSQCRTPDGRTFVNSHEVISSDGPFTPMPDDGNADVPITANGCQVGGCSGQICGEAGEELVSTCEYRAEYACYKEASCERQANGKCGWTQTAELQQCLATGVSAQ